MEAQGFAIDKALTNDDCKQLGNVIASSTMESDRAKMNGGICEHICRFGLVQGCYQFKGHGGFRNTSPLQICWTQVS